MLHAVVMAGGSGTRFWPKSRRNRPKQLIDLFGEGTLLRQTVARIAPLIPAERVRIITGSDQADAVRKELPEMNPANVVAEPCPRDTAPCVGLAAAIIAKIDPNATMLVMPADHVIRPAEAFLKTVSAAVAAIEEDPSAFVTFGVKPTRAETGYGYIERGELLGRPDGIAMHRVIQFREKPDRATAERFVAEGRFSWNAGIFLWKARAILDAIAEHRPTLAAGLSRIARSLGTPDEAATIAHEFPRLERIPIDKAVMEKATNVRVLEVTYNWSDVGDWRSLAELLPADVLGNTGQGPVHAIDTKGSIIIADEGKLITTLGVEDLVVIQSGGATLVAKRDQLDKLKGLVEGLEGAGSALIFDRNSSRMPRILGLDFGTKRIGAAISDARRQIASPLEVYERRDTKRDTEHYRKIVREESVEMIVVGLPLHTGGGEGELAILARRFGAWMGEITALPVTYYDERYTSYDAEETLRASGRKLKDRKALRDMLAARILLQNFLDAGCPMVEAPALPLDDFHE